MSDSNVIKLAQPGAFTDSLTEILRSGARALLTQAVEAEVAEFLARHADLKTETGQQRVVRHGHLPQREIMTGIGPVAVCQPRVRDREAAEGERIRYSPSIVPPYARRSKSLEVLIPVLYLKGISSGDFEEALAALVGKDAPGLSASTIARLKELWTEEHSRWQKRDLWDWDLIPPAVQQGKQPFRARVQLLARLTLNPGKHTGNQPARLAQLDDGNDRAILVQGDEGSAQSLPRRRPGSFGWGIAALHRLMHRRSCHFLAARLIASLGPPAMARSVGAPRHSTSGGV